MIDLRLLIIAADPLVRAALATLLDGQPGLQIVAHLPISDSLMEEFQVYQPDIILWDFGWEFEESLGLLDELDLAADAGSHRLLALVGDNESASQAYLAGAQGLLYREVDSERLAAAIQALGWGLVVVEPELVDELSLARVSPEAHLVEPLTSRELEVLHLLAEGLSNKAIAQQLEISDHTVKFHVNAIMSKLGAQSRTAAVVQATRLGLIVL